MQSWLLAVILGIQAFTQSLVGVVPEDVQASFTVPSIQTEAMQTIRKDPIHIAPVIHADAAITVDRETGKVLFSYDAHKKLPIASITKIMTALVVREYANLDEVVTISGDASRVEGSEIKLVEGEKITVEDLLKGLLVKSGNDAAWALAEYVGKGSVEEFTKLMNARARKENLTNTHFANPIGFDDINNYSTAYELSLLADILLQDDVLREIVGLKKVDIISVTGQKHLIESTNKILGGYLDIRGLKTGTTEEAGNSLLSVSYKDGHEIIGVLLNSQDRFREMKIMLDWCYRAYTWGK